jgi:hypothetical protein
MKAPPAEAQVSMPWTQTVTASAPEQQRPDVGLLDNCRLSAPICRKICSSRIRRGLTRS